MYVYGFSATFITVFCYELNGFWLFTGATIIATLFEWVSGHIIEKIYHRKWWNYSDIKYNLDGYICLPMSLLWGTLSYLVVRYINNLILNIINIFPRIISSTVLIIILSALVVDVVATFLAIYGDRKGKEKWKSIDRWIIRKTFVLQEKVYNSVNNRINKAYSDHNLTSKTENEKGYIFADGCSFYKIVLIFIIGSFVGDIVEMVFCRITAGVWMSRSSVVWGPFSIVWGGAFAGGTILLYRYRKSSSLALFTAGAVLGGVYEYLCSVFTEIFFGTVFWDYSHMKFNLGGRINLLYCLFWGIAAVIWMKVIYPCLSDVIERIPMKTGKIVTWVLIIFMSVNMFVSGMALIRYTQRHSNIPAQSKWQQNIDRCFDNERIEKIYPNIILIS